MAISLGIYPIFRQTQMEISGDIFPFQSTVTGSFSKGTRKMTWESYGFFGAEFAFFFPRSMQPIPLFSNKVWKSGTPIPSIGESFSLFKWPKYWRVSKIIKADPHHIKIIKLILNPLKSHQMSWSKFHDIQLSLHRRLVGANPNQAHILWPGGTWTPNALIETTQKE